MPRRSARPPRVERPAVAGWQSRLAAADLLVRTRDGGADLDTAMGASEAFARLEGADRGFARAIAGAALRGAGRIDWALGGMLDRSIEAIEPEVRALLRAGAAQIWMLGVAEHAAVSATVEAARHWHEARRGGGLVNAVLRRATREGEAFDNAPPTSVWPDWLAAKMKAALGADRADAMARLQLEEPPFDLSLKPGADAEELSGLMGGEVLPNGSVRIGAGVRLTELPGYADGAWWVQDAAASLAAPLLGDMAGKSVADLCAAPGGKALQLAAAGAKLTALDISRQRLAQLRENAGRMKVDIEVVEADARDWRPADPLDGVLLDAPCSALGVLRRHPEGAWRRDPKDLARFPKIQGALVAAARDMLKPGGRLVYCVCTPSPEEGREVIEAALATGGWRRDPVLAADVPGFAAALTPDGDLLTAPPASPDAAEVRDSEAATPRNIDADPVPSDVFFMARLVRTP